MIQNDVRIISFLREEFRRILELYIFLETVWYSWNMNMKYEYNLEDIFFSHANLNGNQHHPAQENLLQIFENQFPKNNGFCE